jgi:hypothetical protein
MTHVLGVAAVRSRVQAPRCVLRSSRFRRSREAFVPKASGEDAPFVSTNETRSSIDDISAAEQLLLSRLASVSGRGASASEADEKEIAEAVSVLERNGGLRNPALREEIEGTWRLLYTSKSKFDPSNPLGSRVDGSKPGLEGLFASLFGDQAAKALSETTSQISEASSSPIQRTVTSLEAFTIQQAVRLSNTDNQRVDQVVNFGDGNYLRLSAKANVNGTGNVGTVGTGNANERSARPDGTIGGAKENSKENSKENENANANANRIDFRFDLAYFEIKTGPFGVKLPFVESSMRIPYPVPFALLGDEAKGWLDTTYLGKDVRVSKGNKGTTFVLAREKSAEEGGTPLPYEF